MVAEASPEQYREQIDAYIQTLVDKEESDPSTPQKLARSPYLAQLEMATRFSATLPESAPTDLVINYINKFATSIVLFEDIDRYLSELIDLFPDKKSAVISFLQSNKGAEDLEIKLK